MLYTLLHNRMPVVSLSDPPRHEKPFKGWFSSPSHPDAPLKEKKKIKFKGIKSYLSINSLILFCFTKFTLFK